MATTYLVLRALADTRGGYAPVQTIEASSSDAAIRAVAGDAEGVYVAVPSRSWNEVSVKVETKTQVRLGEAPTRPKLAATENISATSVQTGG